MEEQWVAPTETELEQIRHYQQIAENDRIKSEAERRRYEREAFSAEITVSSATNFFMGFSEDISEGGLFISTMSPPRVDDEISIEVKVGEGEVITVEGVVRWHRYVTNVVTGCGIQFKQLAPDAQ
ncbi:MAG: hypothetical protein ACI8S6_004711, partial [Myxococcota bacterium]